MAADSTDSADVVGSSLASVSVGALQFFAGRVVKLGLGFLLSILLSNQLGAALYGLYAYGNTVLSTIAMFADLGGERGLLKYLPMLEDDPVRQRRVATVAFGVAGVVSLVVATVVFAAAPLINRLSVDVPAFTTVLRLFAVVLPLQLALKLLGGCFRALDLLRFQVLTRQILEPAAKLLAAVLALLLGYSVVGYVALIVAAVGLTAVVGFALLFRYSSLRPKLTSAAAEARGFYRFSLPLAASNVESLIYNKVDLFMVGAFLTASAVGVYSISVLLAGLLLVPLTALNQLFAPIASRLHENDRSAELGQLYRAVTRLVIGVSLVLTAALIVYRAEVLSLFGPEFTAGTAVLAVVAVGQFLNSVAGPANYLLMMTDHQDVVLVNNWVFAALNAGLNYALILEFGLIGAGIATAATIGLLNTVRIVEIWWFERMVPYSIGIAKPIVAGGAAALVMLGWQEVVGGVIPSMLGAVPGGIAFLLVLYALGLAPLERQLLARALASLSPDE